MRQLTPAQPKDGVPDWVYSQMWEEHQNDRDEQAASHIKQAYLLRHRDKSNPEDNGEDGWHILGQVQQLLTLTEDMGIVSRSILSPLVLALDPSLRMAEAAQLEATKLDAERLGVDLDDDLEPSDF